MKTNPLECQVTRFQVPQAKEGFSESFPRIREDNIWLSPELVLGLAIITDLK